MTRAREIETLLDKSYIPGNRKTHRPILAKMGYTFIGTREDDEYGDQEVFYNSQTKEALLVSRQMTREEYILRYGNEKVTHPNLKPYVVTKLKSR